MKGNHFYIRMPNMMQGAVHNFHDPTKIFAAPNIIAVQKKNVFYL